MPDVEVDSSTARRFRLEIEGLRAVAALLVAAYHVWFGRVSGGVDVFFVIAGFMVTTTLLGHLNRTGRIDIGRYLGRLLRRLLPNALLVLAVVALASWWLVPITRRDEVFTEIAASALYYENWELAGRSVDYLARDFTNSPVQHFWAMSIQGQFYLIWLVLFLVLLRVGSPAFARRRIGLAMVVLVLASFTFSAWFTGVNQGAAYFNTGTRVWEFGVGGLLAMSLPWWPRLGRRLSWTLGWIGLIAIVSCGAVLAVGTSFPGWIALWPVTGAALILFAGHTDARWAASGLLSTRPLVGLGSVSYALYLWHWPLLVFVLAATESNRVGALEGLAIIAVAIVLSFLSTHVVERPIRSLRVDGRRSWSIPLASMLLVAPVAGTGYSVAARSGQAPDIATTLNAERYPGARVMDADATQLSATSENTLEPAPDIASAPEDIPVVYDQGCHQAQNADDVVFCEYGDPEADRTMILTGGSHSAHWQPTLELVAQQRGWRLLSATKSNCRPGSHLVSADFEDPNAGVEIEDDEEQRASCRAWNAASVEWIVDEEPDLVVLTSTVVQGPGGGEAVPEMYSRLWKELTAADIEVLAIRDTPRSSFDVPDCLAADGPMTTECDIPRARMLASADPTKPLADALDTVTFVDLTPYLCADAACPAVIGNVIVYSDASHLTRSYSRSLAEPLLTEARILR